MLQYLHVGKKAGEKWLFADFNCEIRGGESAWLEGVAGAGKSVLVDMAIGMDVPTTGAVFVDSASISKSGFAALQRIRRGISLVRDDDRFDVISSVEWMELGLWCGGKNREQTRTFAREAVSRAGLRDLSDVAFCDLSGGQRAALSLSRALARKPHLMLFDWPGIFDFTWPAQLAVDLRQFIADGGAMLSTGKPGGQVSDLHSRAVSLEPRGEAS
jgi:ABC-type methionine transport system ATPase subunit